MSDDDHPILTTAGIVAVAVGLLFVFQPGLASAIGTGYAAVTMIGLLALIQGIRVVRSRQATDLRAAETPDVETVESMPTPGDEFDETVAELRSGPRRVLIRERADLRDALEEAALTAVADRENCSRDEAADLLDAGTWTDDPHAATFLGGSDAPSPPLLDRMKIAASGESPFQFRIRRTADAVARAAGVEADASDGGGRSDGGGGSDGSGRSGTGRTGGDGTDSDESATRAGDGPTDDAEATGRERDGSARKTEVEA
ncbi:DUF308 domain-containing protein [Halorussus lipolyticus]|uniref:DUF308 domain-containing protein n=1 Tax=Halorussus lipolyticus TaxID=3034024 RepID=UPI0023E895CE|nr:DUF308 domain-containing protein [Halorussus sp. DT80]